MEKQVIIRCFALSLNRSLPAQNVEGVVAFILRLVRNTRRGKSKSVLSVVVTLPFIIRPVPILLKNIVKNAAQMVILINPSVLSMLFPKIPASFAGLLLEEDIKRLP